MVDQYQICDQCGVIQWHDPGKPSNPENDKIVTPTEVPKLQRGAGDDKTADHKEKVNPQPSVPCETRNNAQRLGRPLTDHNTVTRHYCERGKCTQYINGGILLSRQTTRGWIGFHTRILL